MDLKNPKGNNRDSVDFVSETLCASIPEHRYWFNNGGDVIPGRLLNKAAIKVALLKRLDGFFILPFYTAETLVIPG